MKPDPRISVVMPVYNGEKYLGAAIESILNQTCPDFEFIIVDDHSTDHSLEIIQKYAEQDERICILENKTNLGTSGTTNNGIELARGEYIALMDQDDISVHERLEKEVIFLSEHPEISVVGANSIRLDEDGNQHIRHLLMATPGLIHWGLLFQNQIQNPTVLMRRDLFSKYGFYYENYEPVQDYRFWLQICHNNKLANLQENLLVHRIHGLNTSLSMGDLHILKIQEIRKDFIRNNLKYNVSDEIAIGLSNPSQIASIQDARFISKIIIMWLRMNLKIQTSEDRTLIGQKSSRMLRDIWNSQNRNPSLLPYVLSTIIFNRI